MVRYAYAFVAMAGLASALPLNINLGAYSPALVVGDGEISFGGEQDVSKLMNVLEGAAVNTAATVANNAANGNTATSTTVNNEVPVPSAAGTTNAAASDPLVEQAQQIANLQGLGNKKEIAPRMQLVDAADDEDDDGDDAATVEKRDLAGFDRALTYAEAALTKGPKVQLGTGKEGSGVGIIVDNSPSTATAAKAAKRDVDGDASPKRVRAKVTTMYVRSGIPASLQSKRDETVPRSVPGIVVPPTAASVSRRDAIDAVNLNVDGDQGLTMTFVETVDDDE
ncbi:uncharacterized protein SPSK_04448 [Sporothrix schenckii 1099-18]|uniref:Uncharacterized protein n=2 Tax=Sporothrix schenckii TaxID=29908 RepID=U7PJQ5_SPOS1|nr:uncharacterized protein SPSK_04448 [Sporothrix schenckii 1099-18]ERS95787.1 hypothetical protein HMPREF1624_07862 [Sporothrix schenckii ATCC 58251]KJR83808.1 hypothetical protein SPSK_04448 [Sporothrix schenckii 1099-18]